MQKFGRLFVLKWKYLVKQGYVARKKTAKKTPQTVARLQWNNSEAHREVAARQENNPEAHRGSQARYNHGLHVKNELWETKFKPGFN